MRVLVISDIHANLTALEVVLNDAGEVDAVWCLGDLVGYGPDPNECIERVAALPDLVCLLGNHDAAALGQIDLDAFNREARLSATWMKSTLKEHNVEFLLALPEKVIVDDVTLVHGSPRNPVWEYLLDTSTAAANFDFFETQFCFVGHSHLPVAYISSNGSHQVGIKLIEADHQLQLNGRSILNPGSVGQPRDHDPRAAYAIFYPQERLWELHRVSYDIQSVQERIIRAGLPQKHASRLTHGW